MAIGKKPCPGCGGPMHRGANVCRACRDSKNQEKRTQPASLQPWSRTETSTTCEISGITDINVRTLDDLIRVCEIDLEIWEIDRWVANKWEVAMKEPAIGASGSWSRDNNKPVHAPLFQIKVWLKKRIAIIGARSEIVSLIESTKEALKEYHPRTGVVRKPIEYMLEPSIPDLHAGKLAWNKETDGPNYDVKIAEQVFEDALMTLIQRTSHFPISQVVFPVGNDLLNADNTINTTTAGTPQDTDARFQKTFGVVRLMITRAIETLRQIAPVLVVMVPGNHDQLSVWHLGDSLECYFHNHDDVTIDNAPTFRKYHQFGEVMLMYTHGDKGKHTDYPLIMATERPMMFGTSRFREAHIGHIHRQRMEEYHGVKVRTTPALCAIDAWHSWNQFTGNNRSAEALVWHRKEGLVGTAFYTVQD